MKHSMKILKLITVETHHHRTVYINYLNIQKY